MKDFDLAIITYLDDKNPISLDSLLSSPSLVLESQYISEDHFIFREAEIILDSLNAYNKGLSNSENQDKLTRIDEQSPFYSWRCAVLAIEAFYNEDQFLVKEYLNDIRTISPLSKIKEFLLMDNKRCLLTPDKQLNSSVDALKEVLNNSLVDMYDTTVNILLQDLKTLSTNYRNNILVTIVEESLDIIPLTLIHQSLLKAVTMEESLRLMALGSIFKHPIISLQYFFSYITIQDFTDRENLKLVTLLEIVSDISKALKKEKYRYPSPKSKKQFAQNSTLFIAGLAQILTLDYKESKDPLTNLVRALKLPVRTTEKVVYSKDVLQGELF